MIGGFMKMTAKELAAMLSGREVGMEISPGETQDAKDAGLVVVYGYFDDLLEFEGAIEHEAYVYCGGTIFVRDGRVIEAPTDCVTKAEHLEWIAHQKKTAKSIKAIWSDSGAPCWTFETDIPHETFDIYEDGEVWCVGIVFSVEDVS